MLKHRAQCSGVFPNSFFPLLQKHRRVLFLFSFIIYIYIYIHTHTFFFNFIYLFIFIFDCAGSSLLCRLFSSCRERGLLSGRGARASLCCGFSCCGARALGHSGFSACSARARYLWLTGLVALQCVGSSRTRD